MNFHCETLIRNIYAHKVNSIRHPFVDFMKIFQTVPDHFSKLVKEKIEKYLNYLKAVIFHIDLHELALIFNSVTKSPVMRGQL